MKFAAAMMAAAVCFAGCQSGKSAATHRTVRTVPPKRVKPAQTVCHFPVQFTTGRVCLDGSWFLSGSFLGKNIPFRFKKNRGGFFMVPELTPEQKAHFRKMLDPGALDTATVTEVLSIQGKTEVNGLFLEQQNPLVPYPETWRYRLEWRNGAFQGYYLVIGRDSRRAPVRVSLSKKNGQASSQTDSSGSRLDW